MKNCLLDNKSSGCLMVMIGWLLYILIHSIDHICFTSVGFTHFVVSGYPLHSSLPLLHSHSLSAGALHSTCAAEKAEAWWACGSWSGRFRSSQWQCSWSLGERWISTIRLCVCASGGLWRADHFGKKYAAEFAGSRFFRFPPQQQLDWYPS